MTFGRPVSLPISPYFPGDSLRTEFQSTLSFSGARSSWGPGTESLQHLFIQGLGASRVWREFDGWFEGSSSPLRLNDAISERLEVWPQRSRQKSKKHLSHSMPYLIMWFRWAERNRSRHQETQFKPFNVIWQVQMFVRNSIANGSIKPKHWKDVKLGVCNPAHTDGSRPIPRAMAVKWNPPNNRGSSLIRMEHFQRQQVESGVEASCETTRVDCSLPSPPPWMHNRRWKPNSWLSIMVCPWQGSMPSQFGLNRMQPKQSA